MSLLTAILIVVLVTAVVAVVSGPLRAARREPETASSSRSQGGEHGDPGHETGEGDLDAAREAKYREIRDAELDYRTGKLSREDYEAIDRQLRAEAVEILHRGDADDT